MNAIPNRPLAARMAEKILGFGRGDLSPAALAQAKTCIADTIGVTLAGMGDAATRILLRTPGVATAPGSSLILASDRRTSALDAALVNGTAAHALDYDDFSSVFGGHQSVPLVAPLFALAEERKLSGERLLLAYVMGVEVEIRLARAVNYHHYDKGWHPTSTLGVFGSAAAAAHLIGLDEAKTATALAIAASFSSGLKSNFGTMTKPLHAGHAARNGLLAALLAESGFEANELSFEHHQGFFNVFNGPGNFQAEKVLEGWAQPLEIEDPGIGLKQFPCCGSTHPAITMMLRLVKEEGLKPEDAARIEVLPHGRRLRHTDNPSPTTPLEAKFSVQYVTARALHDGAVRLKDFENGRHLDPEILPLLKITEARPHPGMPDDAPEQWGAEVIVTTKAGKRLSRRVDNLVGRSGKDAMSTDEVWEKFSDCAAGVIPPAAASRLFEMLLRLEKVEDVGEVAALMYIPAGAGRSSVEQNPS